MVYDDQVELLTAEEEQEFLGAVASGFCPNCGERVDQAKRGRIKKFCSDRCRYKWKNKHPKVENWRSTRTAVCLYCGREFTASREYKQLRKYCSHACANRGRAVKGSADCVSHVGGADGVNNVEQL